MFSVKVTASAILHDSYSGKSVFPFHNSIQDTQEAVKEAKGGSTGIITFYNKYFACC